jgi:hypothetical protein
MAANSSINATTLTKKAKASRKQVKSLFNYPNIMEPKSIEEVPSWVIVNALKCPVDAQISIVAKLLQHLSREQQSKALSMSGVVGQSEQLVCDVCGSNDVIEAPHMGKNCNRCHPL